MTDLQKIWDKFLIESFYKFPHDNANHVVAVFVAKNNITFEDLKELKRVPKSHHHQRVTISRFVCAFLPTIAKALWDHNIDQLDKLAAAVSKLSSDAREKAVDNEKLKKEVNEVRSSKNQNNLTKIKKKAMSNLYQKYNRSNQWGVTK